VDDDYVKFDQIYKKNGSKLSFSGKMEGVKIKGKVTVEEWTEGTFTLERVIFE